MPFWAQFVIINTHFMREQLISWGVPASKINYLPNGIDRERFSLKDPKKVRELKQVLELENKHVIAYIGTIGLTSHAVDLLIESFVILLKEMPDSVLMMVGGGEDFQRLQAYCQTIGLASSIRWIGKVAPELIPLYYQLADVTVDPVRDDWASRGRAPLKLFESWACGIPFVSADVGDRSMILGDPPAGLLVQPGDPGALARAILKILSDKELAVSLRLRGLKRIEDYYWDRLILKLNGIYA
jgi:glycosyltransferase involved in cell wall biosynthesis